MVLILDHIPRTPLLEGVDCWPKSATREEWIALTRDLIASTIAEMGEYLDDAETNTPFDAPSTTMSSRHGLSTSFCHEHAELVRLY